MGTKLWFEYHCYEDDDSADREAWYRSHQQVVIIQIHTDTDDEVGIMYRVRFEDHHEHDVFEDELLLSTTQFTRPTPPPYATRT